MNLTASKSINKFGISSDDLDLIIKTICLNKKIEKIILFGSRAKGNYKKGSDIDIAIIAENLNFDELLMIKVNINELFLPYKIDIIDFNKLENQDLIKHIKRVGIKIKGNEK